MMFVIYHNIFDELTAVDVGTASTSVVSLSLRKQGWGLNGILGAFCVIDAKSEEEAVTIYRNSLAS
jgi:hypothetical protein